MEDWGMSGLAEQVSQEMELDYRRYPRPLSEEEPA